MDARFCKQPSPQPDYQVDSVIPFTSPMPRILVVDDDEAYRSLITEHLVRDYQVVSTGNPEKAVTLAVEEEPDIIILDLVMPGISGFELCQTLSSLSFTQHIPIFIVSSSDERNKGFCQNLGASRFYTKPVDFVKLKADLESALSSAKMERRRELRVPVKLNVTLRGKSKAGSFFQVSGTTENVSKSGFLCSCDASIDEGASVEVFLSGENERELGQARLVRTVPEPGSAYHYGFQFIGLWANPLTHSYAR
jgi:DNA-binding response OmpR family regulator